MTASLPAPSGHEIVFGLIAPIGTNLSLVSSALEDALRQVNYRPEVIRVSSLLEAALPTIEVPRTPLDRRYKVLMDIGDRLRQESGQNDVAAALAILEIRKRRKERDTNPNQLIPRTAYIIYQLKHPAEVQTLREIYGQGFFLISAYSPRYRRRSHLVSKLKLDTAEQNRYIQRAEELVSRDERSGEKWGQNVRDAFPMADVFVDEDKSRLSDDITRFIQLLFAHPFHTPTRDENAMFHAYAAGLRSAEMGRQVGAAVSNTDGDILALGVNEVPKFGGGSYWPLRTNTDEKDVRDFTKGFDTSDVVKRRNLKEVLHILSANGWLNTKDQSDQDSLLEQCLPLMKHSRIMNSIEFGRAVHAELDAITSAARRGIGITGSTLYTTTFPCHNCAKHIIAAGIQRVVYIEPYAKSLASEFHDDAICVEMDQTDNNVVKFQPFIGIAPRLYTSIFSMGDRKTADGSGNIINWNARSANLRYVSPLLSVKDLETARASKLYIASGSQQVNLEGSSSEHVNARMVNRRIRGRKKRIR